MQLALPQSQRRALGRFSAGTLFALCMFTASAATAQVTVNTTTTFYRESGGPLEQTTYNPSLHIRGDVQDVFTVRAGWEADIVSGASVAVVDAPGAIDAITSATKWDDLRNTASGGIGIASDFARLDATYTYGHESDYRSHGFQLAATAELFERNTRFEVSYGRGFDKLCNLSQPRAQEAVDQQRLPTSDGCFGGDERVALDVDLHTLQAGWTQAWAPIFVTQVTLTAQVLDGYLSNPYRAVWLGRASAQEHHPSRRGRYAAGLALRLWIEPLSGALQLFGRVYRDTWDVFSITAEVAYELTVTEGLRVRLRGRYYNQGRAAFYSNDYSRFPRGQYFTGDRELSPMSSWVVGGRLEWDLPSNDEGTVGPFAGFSIVAKFDWVKFDFRDFNYGAREVPNDRGITAALGLEARF